MADQTATFRVVVIDEASGSVTAAADSLAKLDKAINDGQQNLLALQKSLKQLKAATTPNAEAISRVTATIDAQKDALASMNAQYLKVSGAARIAGKSSSAFVEDLKDLEEELGGIPGPVGKALSSLRGLAQMFSKNSAAVIGAGIAGAAILIVGAVGKATAALYEMGVAAADLRRSEALKFEVGGDSSSIMAAIDDIAARVPLARSEVVEMASDLYVAGKRGEDLKAALAGVAFTKAAEGGDIADQMASLTVQAMKAKESTDALFGGLQLDPYLKAWREVTDLMSQSTVEGKALREIMTALLQPLIDASKSVAPYVKKFFQGMILAGLNFAIVLVTIGNFIAGLFPADVTQDADDFSAAIWAGEAALWAIVAVLGVASIAIGVFAVKGIALAIPWLWSLAAAAWGAMLPFLPFILAALGLGAAIATLIVYWDELVQAFEDVDWLQLGIDIIDGLLRGILPGYDQIKSAMTGLGGAAIDAFKKVIGAASPAKMFVAVGETIPQGVAVGVEAGAPEARAATESMLGDVPRLGAAGGEPPASAQGGAGIGARAGASITIGDIVINASSSDPATLAQDFRRELERVLAALALEIGAPQPEGA